MLFFSSFYTANYSYGYHTGLSQCAAYKVDKYLLNNLTYLISENADH